MVERASGVPRGRVEKARRTPSSTVEADAAERMLGRVVALGLPSATLVGAIVVGALSSVGSALLVLAAGALLGTIALLWASLRTLSGDAPLPADRHATWGAAAQVDALAEDKRRALRALKDLESEHALGKIDDADYQEFVSRYREEAKALMRKMDDEVGPARQAAEVLVREFIARGKETPVPRTGTRVERLTCLSCAVSNDSDAAFCKRCGGGLPSPEDAR